MSTEKPLHAQVAEAIGCTPTLVTSYPNGTKPSDPFWTCACRGRIHNCEGVDGAPNEGDSIEAYDTDWSATGPLIERFGITISDCKGKVWEAFSGFELEPYAWAGWNWNDFASGQTPLVAVCNLILALKAAGKLPVDTRGPEAVTSGASHGS